MESARVAILMPVYNVAEYLREALDSILQQSYSDFRIYIVDDCSTDNTVEVIQSYTDERIHLIQQVKNGGIVPTMNAGLDALQEEEYVVRMDGDDISVPDRLEQLIDFLEHHPDIGVCSSSVEVFGSKSEVWHYETDPMTIRAGLVFEHLIGHAASAFRAEVFREKGFRYTMDLPHGEDYDLFFRLRDEVRMSSIQEPLYRYRILDHNVTVRNQSTYAQRVKNYYKKVLSELEITPSDENLDVHFALARLTDLPEDPKVLSDWKKTLIRQNLKLAIYPHAAFVQVIEKKWDALFFKYLPKGKSTVKSYFEASGGAKPEHAKYYKRYRLNKLLGRA